MDPLNVYSIPVRGLNTGTHQYEFSLDWRFFQLFENSPVKQAAIDVEVILEKKNDHLQVEFLLEGSVEAQCDRCLAPISLPIESQQWLIVKYGEDKEDEAEVVYIHREEPRWNVAQYLYEYSLLAMPIQNVVECEEMEPRPCDMQMLERLKPKEDDDDDNPLWDQLKNLVN